MAVNLGNKEEAVEFTGATPDLSAGFTDIFSLNRSWATLPETLSPGEYRVFTHASR